MVQAAPSSPDLSASRTAARRAVWGLGVLVALALAALALSQADEVAVFRWFNRAGFLPGAVWEGLSVLGLGVSAVIVLMMGLQRRPQVIAALWWSFITVGLPIHVLKRLVERPRPPAVLPLDSFQIWGQPLTQGALPSGHSGTAMAVMAIVLLASPAVPRKAWVWPVTIVLCLGVLWSRMACGAHWPWDVWVGGTLGCVGGWLALWLGDRTGFARWCGSARAQPWLALLLLIASVGSALDKPGYPQAVGFQWALALAGSLVALRRLLAWMRSPRVPGNGQAAA